MSLRLIQVTVPGGHEIEDLLEEYPVTAVWQDSRSSEAASEAGPSHIVQFAVPAEATEAIMDRLEDRLGSVEGFRLALLSVEALLPRQVPRESPESSDSSEAAEPESSEEGGTQRERISREELYSDISEGLGPTPVFLAMAGLSAAVAALGLLRDDLAVVIGAMVIAPLLQPNVALALAATLGDIGLAWRAIKAIASGAGLALVLAAAAGLLLPVDPTLPTLAARSSLDLGALAMAAAAGAAGALAFTRGLAGPVIGVMVAVALLPPLVAFGVLAGAGQWRPAFGALLLCFGNTICINLAGIATFLLQGIRPRTWWEKERARRATLIAAVIWAALLVSLVILLAVIEPPAAMAAEWTPQETALPGAPPISPELAARLIEAGRDAWAATRADGARSEHLRPDGSPLYVNRLILEDSPYLRQHAHNPVAWQPFGPQAFEMARRTGRPIFLSIGYSTCHWCHVMERESFENVEVAERLNRDFVPVKVDREQRPEVDEVYMTALVLMSGSGGWPLSAFLTPDGRPFLAGTYIPRGRFLDLLDETAGAWRTRRPKLEARAAKVVEAVARLHGAAHRSEAAGAGEVGEEAIAAAVRQIVARHDPRLGGFTPAPKFPHEAQLLLLLRQALRQTPSGGEAWEAAEVTLDHMALGGLYDQVGGGFHRYSTDAEWLVPHFEKMLYNQAHLTRAYLEAYLLSAKPLYERVVRQTLDYVLAEMTAPGGGFYSATDADSEGREGAFFVWTPDEVRAALPAADAELALRLFGVSEAGNFEGRNILHLDQPLADVAATLGRSPADLESGYERIRRGLFAARQARPHPLRDEKIVTAWNGMMITTLARAGSDLGEERYLAAARRAAGFLWRQQRRADGRLWRISLDGGSSPTSSIEATHNDYAYLVEALVTLYDADGERLWLDRAARLADVMLETFWDETSGGFFLSASDPASDLPVRPKSVEDLAIPSGNSVAVRALAMLGERTGEISYRQKAAATLAAWSGRIRRQPVAHAYMLLGADELLHGGAGRVDYGAQGRVAVRVAERAVGLDRVANGAWPVTLWVEIAPGWHVNAHEPLDETLIPTRLAAVAGVSLNEAAVEYPAAERLTLGFQDEPLAVYQGRVAIRAAVTPMPHGVGPSVARLTLRLQACDDRRCLEPEDLELAIPIASGGRRPAS